MFVLVALASFMPSDFIQGLESLGVCLGEAEQDNVDDAAFQGGQNISERNHSQERRRGSVKILV